MTAAELWNDHTFRVLLQDMYKARKDDTMGPMRLDALMMYAAQKLYWRPSEPPVLVPETKSLEQQRQVLRDTLNEGEPPPPATLDYLAAQIAARPKPGQVLEEAANFVSKVMATGQWDGSGTMRVRVPKTFLLPGLKDALRQRRLQFTDMTFSMPPADGKIPDSVRQMSLDAAEGASGAQGARTSGAEIVITR